MPESPTDNPTQTDNQPRTEPKTHPKTEADWLAYFTALAPKPDAPKPVPRPGREILRSRFAICRACSSHTAGKRSCCDPIACAAAGGVSVITLAECPRNLWPAPPIATTLDFNLSDRCNLSCPFCYTRNSAGSGPDMKRTWSILEWFERQSRSANRRAKTNRRNVNIFGGEPLLEWGDLTDTVVLTKQKWPALDWRFKAVTNMTLLSRDRLDWCIANNVVISPSIDGNPEAETLTRGARAASVVFDNAREMLSRKTGVSRSCRMTLIPATAPMLCDSIIYLAENIGFQTVNCILAGGVEWTPETIDVIKAEITRLTAWWIDKARAGKWYGLYHLANMFRGLWSGQRKRTVCDAGKSRVAVDTRGDLWPCHRFCNLDSKPEYRLGNIETGYTNLGLYQRLKSFDLAVEYADRCASCPAALGCHAFCLHETMIAGGNALAAPKDYTCRLWPHYWSEAVRAHETLTRENNALYLAKRQASRKTS